MRFGKRIIIFFFFVSLSCARAGAAENLSYPFTNKDRDPLSPLVSKNGQLLLSQELDETGLHLQGIIYAQGNSVAIINGEVVKEKGVIGNYTVVTIEQKKIILKKGNEEFTLKLEE
jgi:hypothetical protein